LLDLVIVVRKAGLPDWGDVPTWVSAVTTILALAAAVVAAVIARRLYKIESERDRRTEADRSAAAEDRRLAAEDRLRAEEDRLAQIEGERRTQADKVAAWWGHPVEPDGRVRTNLWKVCVRNASDLPIYDITLLLLAPDEQADGTWAPIPLGSFPAPVAAVPPSDTIYVDVPSPVAGDVRFVADKNNIIGVEFRDATGTRWKRDPQGVLTEVI
jgi:hypothetical protein